MDQIKCSDSRLFAVFIIIFASSLFLGVSAQDSTGCTTTLVALTPCFGYLSPGNTSQPSSDCCAPIGQILSSNTSAACLCQAPSLAKSAGVSINETRALEVAKECKQTVPSSVTECLSVPSSTPSSTPSPPALTSPPSSPGNGSSGSGSNGNKNDGGILTSPSFFFGFILAVVCSHFVLFV
ncbi:hypothetical protein KP509_12G092700 [Ceratopteris richardii]|uniref:Bifunctional inhibitor/plant lipid transfer protein/seed storage helical domain-containing protein n=1 Tax=Ceratopteris richardii TaxID=49495 RepID=A0A8T2TL55_CERRI|nr:hypothetical protein KP509_12G092700 [Ceratopteris richardii]